MADIIKNNGADKNVNIEKAEANKEQIKETQKENINAVSSEQRILNSSSEEKEVQKGLEKKTLNHTFFKDYSERIKYDNVTNENKEYASYKINLHEI